jgi:hypothetical protein
MGAMIPGPAYLKLRKMKRVSSDIGVSLWRRRLPASRGSPALLGFKNTCRLALVTQRLAGVRLFGTQHLQHGSTAVH